jgi:adenylate cyclase
MELDMDKIKTIPVKNDAPNEQNVWKVLCVDDEPGVLNALKRLLKTKPYRVFLAKSAKDGLLILAEHDIDVVISDMRMPEMSGAQFLAEVAQRYSHTIRILLTGYSDMGSTIAAVNEGQINRYLQKPWNNHEMLQAIESSLYLFSLEKEKQQLLYKINQQNKSLQELNKGLEDKVMLRTRQIRTAMTKLEKANISAKNNHNATLKVFYNLISQNKNLGGKAALQVSELCKLMAKKMALDSNTTKAIHLAGLLSELGLLGMPDELLALPYAELTAKQQKAFNNHPIQAYITLTPASSLENVALIIKHQYEQINGQGFPDGLDRNNIPIGSRILAIARDYIYAISGKLHDTRNNSNGAMDLLIMNADRIYDGKILELLPEILPALEHENLKANEHLISIEQLQAGMELSRNLFSKKDVLLLPEGHCFNADTLQRLKSYTDTAHQTLTIYIFEEDPSKLL